MKELITLCGDNCMECPRYNARSEDELRAVAELWYKVGWRDRVVSNEEIRCSGCSSHKDCTYHLIECTDKHHVKKCNECTLFPQSMSQTAMSARTFDECHEAAPAGTVSECEVIGCDKISDMLKRSNEYQKKCKEVCTEEEYGMLERAFFNKENNLKK